MAATRCWGYKMMLQSLNTKNIISKNPTSQLETLQTAPTMSSTNRSLLRYLPAVFILAGQAVSKHTHHHHHHHARQAAGAVPIAATDSSPTAMMQATRMTSSASSEVISDIKDIQKGIYDLPGDLLDYIQSIEQQLGSVESLLQSLLSGPVPTSSRALAPAQSLSSASTPTISMATSRRGPAPFTASAVPTVSTARPVITTSSSFRPTTTPTSRVTSTRTPFATVTTRIPVYTTGAVPRPMSFIPRNETLSTTRLASRTGVKALTMTVAVIPLPSSTMTSLGVPIASMPTTFATLMRTA